MLKLKPVLLLAVWVLAVAPSQAVDLNPTHPERYVVKRGDTLWDISGTFLRRPWEWPEIWHVNPQIANPHLIYPGDVLSLSYLNGKPRLGIERRGKRTVRLSPYVRKQAIAQPVPTIPLEAIAPFLTQPMVKSQEELDAAPYVVEIAHEHLVAGAGQKIYVRGLAGSNEIAQSVTRPEKPYKDGVTGEVIGVEARYVGAARIIRDGDPATLRLTSTDRESLVGDRLFPTVDKELRANFYPKAPSSPINGRIIRVLDGVSQIGSLQIVALDRGIRDGLAVGDVLQVDQAGEVIRDTVTRDPRDTVKLPDEPAGHVMVFRTFDRVSFALVMDATRPMHLLDIVRNPDS